MLASFRKIFLPTEDELKRQQEFIENIQNENRDFWLSKGLTYSEYEFLRELEYQESSNLSPYQYYVNRRNLLEDNIITLKQVYADIKRWEVNKC